MRDTADAADLAPVDLAALRSQLRETLTPAFIAACSVWPSACSTPASTASLMRIPSAAPVSRAACVRSNRSAA